MDVLEAIKSRRSIRKYKEEPQAAFAYKRDQSKGTLI
jgi:nitroreductase